MTATAAIFIPIVGTGNRNAKDVATVMPNKIGRGGQLFNNAIVGTPPNALIYEKAKIPINAMIKNGIVLNFIAVSLVAFFTIFISGNFLPTV